MSSFQAPGDNLVQLCIHGPFIVHYNKIMVYRGPDRPDRYENPK